MGKNGFVVFVKKIYRKIRTKTRKFQNYTLHFTGASCIGNTIVGLGKLAMGIMSLSFFTCASAFYTFGMVGAKGFAIFGEVKEKNVQKQYRYYRLSGIVLTIASITYIVYSIRLFLNPVITVYNEYIAIGIATVTFTEIGLNTRGIFVDRHRHSPLRYTIRVINLASSLISLVLTQTAILSFASTHVDIQPQANGIMGTLMGTIATILGVYLIIRITRIQKNKNYQAAYRKIKKLMHKNDLKISMKPVYFRQEEGELDELSVVVKEELPYAKMQKLLLLSEETLHIHLNI